MGSVTVRLWGGPRCGESIALDTGVYGKLPDDLEFTSPHQPSLEDVMNPDNRESRIVPEKVVYVLSKDRGANGVVLYSYKPYVCH